MEPLPIRDISAPIPIPDPSAWIGFLLVGSIVLAIAALAVGFWRRRSASPASAEERALERLGEARALIDPSRAREFAFAVSTAVRFYIEERFDERAAHRTTDEFLRELALCERSPLAARRGLLERFLAHCDLVKFARLSLAREEMEALLELAVGLVRPGDRRPDGELAGGSR
ncbi:hypothetical protein MYXO_01845 [Myxococcaceae bacterium]|jgi:hypothetical protein|nr:hypothetical protein MYXO_01845 [Myxococcaceae bacterium]